jgi:hypothetical protein
MQEIIVVTKKKVIISIPVSELINLTDDDTVAGVVLIETETQPKIEEV